MRVSRIFASIVLSFPVVFCQSTPARQEFEVASVRQADTHAPDRINMGLHLDGAQVSCTSLSFKDAISIAYRLKEYQVIGPEWIGTERYDIRAKLPDGATMGDVPAMLQTLLTDRFRMKTHRETKDLPVYALTVAKGGPKMKESPLEGGATGDWPKREAPVNVNVSGGRGGTIVDLGKGASFSIGEDNLEATKLTMTALADVLARFVDIPVLDMTGLTSTYDFKLKFQPDDFRAMRIRAAIKAGVSLPPEALRLLDNSSDAGLETALQAVGLKIERKKAPVEVLVIDSAQKTPVEN